MRMSAQETYWGHAASTIDFTMLINSLFRIPKFLTEAISDDTFPSIGSTRIEASHPFLIMKQLTVC